MVLTSMRGSLLFQSALAHSGFAVKIIAKGETCAFDQTQSYDGHKRLRAQIKTLFVFLGNRV